MSKSCNELVTVGWLWEYAQYRTDERGYYGYETVITENNPTDHVSPAEKLRNIRELVTRRNAEAVIVAKDERIKELEADNKRLREALEEITKDVVQTIFGPCPTQGSDKARAVLGGKPS